MLLPLSHVRFVTLLRARLVTRVRMAHQLVDVLSHGVWVLL